MITTRRGRAASELVRIDDNTSLLALNHDGSELWRSTLVSETDIPLVIADVDDDGIADVLAAAGNGSRPRYLQVFNGSAAEIGNNTVSLIKGAITSPVSSRRGCFLDADPGCEQLVFPDGFDSAYVNDGPLALPAPVLIVTFGMTSGNIGVFVGIFLPTEPVQN